MGQRFTATPYEGEYDLVCSKHGVISHTIEQNSDKCYLCEEEEKKIKLFRYCLSKLLVYVYYDWHGSWKINCTDHGEMIHDEDQCPYCPRINNCYCKDLMF